MEYFTDEQKQHAIRPGEVVIEIDQEHHDVKRRLTATDAFDPLNPSKRKIVETVTRAGNRHYYFPPVDMRSSEGGMSCNFIRTRRELIRDGEDARFAMDKALRKIDYIPGERIHWDQANRIGRITDSIFDPENDATYQVLKEIGIEIHGTMRPFVPGIYHEVKFHDDLSMWNWAYHMRKIMDGNKEHCSGPDRHKGCSTTGTRLCRPIQNVEQMPTMVEILKTGNVKIPLPRMNKDDFERFEHSRKESDPDYQPADLFRGEVTMTPFLAGISRD